MTRTPVPIRTEEITLGDFLKWAGAVSTGGQAKLLLKAGSVTVNGVSETRRGRRLRAGDYVDVAGGAGYVVEAEV